RGGGGEPGRARADCRRRRAAGPRRARPLAAAGRAGARAPPLVAAAARRGPRGAAARAGVAAGVDRGRRPGGGVVSVPRRLCARDAAGGLGYNRHLMRLSMRQLVRHHVAQIQPRAGGGRAESRP
ncbi:MAG: hypothetical protein EXR65_02650, partial [Dehalococcoidia bacterium]|nr:hypothetical protein [Dehalococcoidia bacterium]